MFKDAEERVNKFGNVSYWKDGVMVGKKCSKCGEDKEICEFSFFNKKKGTYRPECKECEKQYREANRETIRERGRVYYETNKEIQKEKNKLWNEKNKEYRREYHKRYDEVNKDRKKQYREANKEHLKEKGKEYYEKNKEKIKERQKQYHENNKERIKERRKEYYEANKEYILEQNKRHREENDELYKEYGRKRYNEHKKENIQNIKNILEQINLIFKEKDLPVYGYVYKIENIKTRRVYIGQTIQPLKRRYTVNIIKGWVEDRKHYANQKFKEELIEEDMQITEVFDVAFCQYHLDKLESYWINYYDSCNNGYNNREGNHITTDGLEDFNKILKENNLEFIDGKLIKIV